MTLEEVLKRVDDFSPRGWLYLPRDQKWDLTTETAVLESEEVPEEEEGYPDAGVPEFAKSNNLKQVLPVTVVQDVVRNLKLARPSPTSIELFLAFKFYYDNDAFGPH